MWAQRILTFARKYLEKYKAPPVSRSEARIVRAVREMAIHAKRPMPLLETAHEVLSELCTILRGKDVTDCSNFCDLNGYGVLTDILLGNFSAKGADIRCAESHGSFALEVSSAKAHRDTWSAAFLLLFVKLCAWPAQRNRTAYTYLIRGYWLNGCLSSPHPLIANRCRGSNICWRHATCACERDFT